MQIQKEINKLPYGVISAVGKRGAGKTYKVLHLDYPTDKVFWIDVVGAFRVEMENKEDTVVMQLDILGSKNELFKILDKCEEKNILLDVSMLSRKDMCKTVDDVCDYLLMHVSGRFTSTLVVDEIGETNPQDMTVYAHRLESVARMGRNKGINWLVMTTQRTQKVNKHIIALSEYVLIFKLTHNLDIDAVRNILGASDKDFRQHSLKIKGFAVGDYVYTDGLDMTYVYRDRKEGNLKPINEVEDNGRSNINDSSRVEHDSKRVVDDEHKPTIKKRTRHRATRKSSVKNSDKKRTGGVVGAPVRHKKEYHGQYASATHEARALIKKGLKTNSIAKQTGLSPKTVYKHRGIMRKKGLI